MTPCRTDSVLFFVIMNSATKYLVTCAVPRLSLAVAIVVLASCKSLLLPALPISVHLKL